MSASSVASRRALSHLAHAAPSISMDVSSRFLTPALSWLTLDARPCQRPGRIAQQRRAFSFRPAEAPADAPAATPHKKVTVNTLRKLHRSGTPIAVLTAHDAPSGRLADDAHMDICLVGDSLAMTALGYKDTTEVTVDEMIMLCRAVTRGGGKRAFVVADMPFGSFATPDTAVRTALRFVKEGGAEAVKLEGGTPYHCELVRRITHDVGIPVMGHVGLTPQTHAQLGGYRVQGRSAVAATRVLEAAKNLQSAGAFSVVLEAIPYVVAREITSRLSIPTIGIGAGIGTSGQVLVHHDMLGVFASVPKFVKRYAEIGDAMRSAIEEYGREVRSREFPSNEVHGYGMPEAEMSAFLRMIADKGEVVEMQQKEGFGSQK